MYSFEEFIEEIRNNILDYLPKEYEDADVDIREVYKNNNVALTGLMVHPENGNNISPTIYLDDYYKKYQNGTNMNGVLEDMADIIASNTPNVNIDTELFTNWENIKERIYPRLSAIKGNEEYLKNKVYTPVDDLAVTYYILVDESPVNIASVTVTNNLFENYNISKEEMHEKAFDNMHTRYPAKVESIVEQLVKVLPPEETEVMRNEVPLYVVSNEKGMNGAVEILDPHTMDLIKETLGNQEYLAIPSSVHEFLIMPMDESGPFREMAAMIQEVNQTAVSKEEILSDHPYKIDPERHLFISADKDITVEKQMENKNIEQKQMDIMMQPNVHKREIEQRGPRL